MSDLDKKINENFAGLVVRKDLVKEVKGNAIVPTYVLEYLLGQYCATNDEESILSGIETVKEILSKHYVHRNESQLVRSNIKKRGRYKIIDKITVVLNDKRDAYEATFSNLGIDKVLIDSDTVNKHKKLLVGGVWCIADIEYEFIEDKSTSPWILSTLNPIQMSHFDYEHYIESRKKFNLEEWIDVLIQSIGFNPEKMSKRNKILQIIRLIPYCERNYNLIELGPKGTGKSHIYSEFSPHGILLSGGEVTVPKLFVNNSTGKLGLVGYWDVVGFDEFAGREKKANKALVDIMKNYMANKSFSRGIETLGAESSTVFVGNTQHDVPYMLKHSDLFDELPPQYHDSAFLDRLHSYIPGWEVDVIRGEMFTDGFGFVVDYLAEILKSLRDQDYSNRYQDWFELSTGISTRDRDGVHKTFSGLMKILFPGGGASEQQTKEIFELSIEGRKRVKDQLMRIDSTYPDVDFSYLDKSGEKNTVATAEEEQYPNYYAQKVDTQKRADPKPPPAVKTEDDPDVKKLDDEIIPKWSEIESLISQGESETLEFKETLSLDTKKQTKEKYIESEVLKTIAGFINSEGGVLLIGVKDDGTISGIDYEAHKLYSGNTNKEKLVYLDGLLRHLGNKLKHSVGMEFYAYFSFNRIECNDLSIIKVKCRKQIKGNGCFIDNEFYVRKGASTEKLEGSALINYIQEHFNH